MITVTRRVHLTTHRAGRKRLQPGAAGPKQIQGRVPRISKLLALAIRMEGLLRDGTVADQSELARLAGVSQPRMTQILNLNHLAPDIQEELLFLGEVHQGRDDIHERLLRPIASQVAWERQRSAWFVLAASVDLPKPCYSI